MNKKPTSLALIEFREQLTELINSSEIPHFVLELVLKDFYREVSLLSQKQTEKERIQYQESFMEQSNNTDNN